MSLQSALRALIRDKVETSTNLCCRIALGNASVLQFARSYAADDSPDQPSDPAAAPPAAVEEAPRKRKKLNRRDLGSYSTASATMQDEVENTSVIWPQNQPLYDVATQMDFTLKPKTDFPAMKQLAEALEADNQEEVMELLAGSMPDAMSFIGVMNQTEPDPSAEILTWEMQMVLHSGPENEQHPLDAKVKCRVYLRDLQREEGLSDAALQHIALIAGPRYNPNSGLMTLTSRSTPDREANRREILGMIDKLVEAGHAYARPTQQSQSTQPAASAS